MSPLTLRRFRAERLLRQQFGELRGRVLTTVRGRLAASGGDLDSSDLDACYAQAWQGLYAAVLEGQEIANPTGWLTLVTFRRAIEELRARRHLAPATEGSEEPDFAAGLDDRMRLRQLFEGLRGRLTAREREAAAFCYLQGLSRAEAAARMGLSQARMRKLMDGQGPSRPGVAGKVGELAATIRGGGWCEEQGSLMRGLAYGILDPDGERYRLAQIHRSECPACRAYVVSLRGLAVVLPPVLQPWGLGADALLRAGAAAHAHAGAGAGAIIGQGAGSQAGAGAQAGSGAAGALSASGAAGAGGAAGGGWLLAGGSLGTKLAVGCALALGVGAGCVALTGAPNQRRVPPHRRSAAGSSATAATRVHGTGSTFGGSSLPGGLAQHRADAAAVGGSSSTPALTPNARAAREFGLERSSASTRSQPVSSPGARTPTAIGASSRPVGLTATGSSTGASASGGASSTAGGGPESPASSAQAGAGPSAAEREFGVG